ncbi:hypothetical protein GCK72_011080 [Caenorhabditis remanei]|uniref:Uncharacterized protein n=1 Tax=Caenorhabditis remanei TaxID=31234 RepID=A0A6A5H6K1_CAERE|nr:hypothetical protein GCK72_011080 [Caenorhabditis remanei]KAF1762817.1 hypothetical protein GCK72_011080 [Caenorhabditis remanei]
MAHPKPIGEQMAALNTSDDTSFAADRSNGVLNATCPARIQNTSFGRNNMSLNESTASSSGGKWLKPKREALKSLHWHKLMRIRQSQGNTWRRGRK